MTAYLWRIVDWTAHALCTLHLIPKRWLAAACDRYDLALGVTPEELARTAMRGE